MTAHEQRADAVVELRKSTVCSIQFHPARRHVEGCPDQEAARYSAPEDTAPSIEDMHELIKLVFEKSLKEIMKS